LNSNGETLSTDGRIAVRTSCEECGIILDRDENAAINLARLDLVRAIFVTERGGG
jgi:transposase